MSCRIEFAAGFREDLEQAFAELPPGGLLADRVPFHDVFVGLDRDELAELFAAAGAAEPWSGAPLSEPASRARQLPDACVTAVARLDDTRIGPLRRAFWARLGRSGEPDPETGQAVRGLVVQCRAARANGWVVVWWTSDVRTQNEPAS